MDVGAGADIYAFGDEAVELQPVWEGLHPTRSLYQSGHEW